MVFWFLLESAVGGEQLPGGVASLSRREQASFERLRFPRRRREWLLGRYAAKVLLSRVEADLANRSLANIEILGEESGAPFVMVDGRRREGTLSISHRAGLAFVAWNPAGEPLGVDVELIESRSPAFAKDFFTDDEYAALGRLTDEQHVLAVTLIWSLKEAALKALRQGLRVDTRQVEVRLASSLSRTQNWQTCEVGLPFTSARWPGRWRRWGDYVLTVVAGNQELRLRQGGYMLAASAGPTGSLETQESDQEFD